MNWYNACDVLDLLHNELDKEVSKGYRWNKIVNVLIILKVVQIYHIHLPFSLLLSLKFFIRRNFKKWKDCFDSIQKMNVSASEKFNSKIQSSSDSIQENGIKDASVQFGMQSSAFEATVSTLKYAYWKN